MITVQVVMKADEKSIIRQAAALNGATMSTFGRTILLREAKKVLEKSPFFGHSDPTKGQNRLPK